MNPELLHQYRDLLIEITKTADHLTETEQALATAASQKDIEKLRQVMQSAEPTLLKFRGLELLHNTLSEKLGFRSKTISTLLAEDNPEISVSLSPCLLQLRTALNQLQDAQSSATRILRTRIMDTEFILNSHPEAAAVSHDIRA
jgi:hypothetical protein